MFGQYGANLNLLPEKSQNLELGASFESNDPKYRVRISTYKRNLTNAIVYGESGYINQANQKVKGFEIVPSIKLGFIGLSGCYAYVEGTEFNFITNAVYDYLLRRPKNTLNINTDVFASKNLFLSSRFNYRGLRLDDDFSSMSVTQLKAYNTVDIYS